MPRSWGCRRWRREPACPPRKRRPSASQDVPLFREYMGKVWASTDELLARADRDAVLGKTVTVKPLGEMPAIVALGNVCLTHGMTHFGEIELARTLVGAPTVSGV